MNGGMNGGIIIPEPELKKELSVVLVEGIAEGDALVVASE